MNAAKFVVAKVVSAQTQTPLKVATQGGHLVVNRGDGFYVARICSKPLQLATVRTSENLGWEPVLYRRDGLHLQRADTKVG